MAAGRLALTRLTAKKRFRLLSLPCLQAPQFPSSHNAVASPLL
jgi:hypothetical protein